MNQEEIKNIEQQETQLSGPQKLKEISIRYFENFLEDYFFSFNDLKEKANYFSSKEIESNSDFILPLKAMPFSLIYKTPILTSYESWLRKDAAINAASLNIYRIAKDLYFKWAIAKDESDKANYRDQLIELCNKNFDDRLFFIYIFSALVLLGEINKNATSVTELLLKAQRFIDHFVNINPLRQKLNYFIQILNAAYYIRTSDFNFAKKKLEDALEFENDGICAKYFSLYISAKLSSDDFNEKYLKEIFFYDVARIIKAVDLSDLNLFDFCIKKAEMKSIIFDVSFAENSDLIERFLNSIKEKINITSKEIEDLFEKLSALKISEFYSKQFQTNIKFFEELKEKYHNSQNIYYLIAQPYVFAKMKKQIGELIITVQTDFEKVLEKKLERFDFQIAECYEDILRIQHHSEKEIEKLEKKKEIELILNEAKLQKETENDKQKLVKIDADEKLKFSRSFLSAMYYNAAVALLVIIIGGIVSMAYNPTIKESEGVFTKLTMMLSHGFKWGGASFFFGWIIATLIALATVFNKFRIKTNITKKIENSSLTIKKELQKIEQKFDNEKAFILNKFNQEIEKNKSRIENLKAQKLKKENELKEDSQSQIHFYQSSLRSIISTE